MEDRYLFRAKRIDNGEWIYGGYCETPPPMQAFGELPPPRVSIYCEHPNTLSDWGMPRQMGLIDVDLATVNQCTGLKDKDGQLVFDGDIVDCIDDIMEICWCSDGACFEGWKVKRNTYSILIHAAESVHVIGNRWDNPELLEGKAVNK